MKFPLHSIFFGAACVGLSACGGCNFFDGGGNSAAGRFMVEPTDDAFSEDIAAMAAGTEATYAVFDYELAPERYRRKPAQMSGVDVSPESVAALRAHHANELTLAGAEAGVVEVAFDSEADNDDIADAFEVEVVEADTFALHHPCGQNLYIAGLTNRVDHYFLAGATRAIGAGWYPMTWSSQDAATLNDALSSQTFVALDIAEGTESLSVRSKLPENSEPLELDIVPLSAVAGAELLDATTETPLDLTGTVPPGWHRVRVVPRVDGSGVCAAVVSARVRSETPRKCSLGFDGLDLLEVDDGEFWLNLDGGSCRLIIEVIGAVVAELVFDVEIEYESSGGGGSDWDD